MSVPFVSIEFLVFFTIVLIVCRSMPRFKSYVLLLASLIFAAWFSWISVPVLILYSVLTYLSGRTLHERRFTYTLAVAANVTGILFFNFTISFREETMPEMWELLTALGLSFYNLQHIAYLADVRSRKIIAEASFIKFLLATAYFPKLISGPVTKFQLLRPQLHRPHATQPELISGCQRILFGFFKKMCVADRLAPGVASVFDYQEELPGVTVIAGGILFTIQLYFDFSGYTDIAIGCSRMLGIHLRENFDLPFRSKSVTEFWRRWHTSLMDFLREYVFAPIAYSLRHHGKYAVLAALATTFALSALWHGIGFTFMLWALCHFIYLSVEYLTRPFQSESSSGWRGGIAAVTVLILVSISHLFFRSTSLSHAERLLTMATNGHLLPDDFLADFLAPMATGGHQIDLFNFYVALFFAFTVLVLERRLNDVANASKLRLVNVLIALILIFLFGEFGDTNRFIYMQF